MAPCRTISRRRREPRPLEVARTARFERYDSAGRSDLLSLPRRGGTPVLDLTQRRPGPVLVAMDRTFASIEFEPEAFREYLAHEGIRGIALPETATVVRERYARCLKTLVQVGDEYGGEVYARPIGQRLELLLSANPYALRAGDTLEVELRFEGATLPGHAVTVLVEPPSGEVVSFSLQTDSAGRARFALPSAGLVVVRTVHLLPCEAREEADWESWWASFSFRTGS